MHAHGKVLGFPSFLMIYALGGFIVDSPALAQSPSFSCAKAEAGSIEEMICNDSELSKLDRVLADVSGALPKAVAERPPMLKAEQRGWIKGRDECWKSDDKRRCVEEEYKHRIVELQTRYRLVSK